MSDLSSLANTSVVNYVSFCLIFFVLKYKYFAEDKFMWVIVFFIVACILQFVNNLYLSSLPLFCGGVQVNISLYATLFPWIIIFGSFAMCLFVFPGWLRAFSNTFGIKAAQMFGIDEVIDELFNPENKELLASKAKDKNNIDLLKAIDSIYTGKILFINELTYDDVKIDKKTNPDGSPDLSGDGKPKISVIWPSLDNLTPAGLTKESLSDDKKKKLYDKILLKDTVAHFIWYVLVGSMTVLVSTNTLLNSGCDTKTGDYNAIFS
jgi:hypothetical protein